MSNFILKLFYLKLLIAHINTSHTLFPDYFIVSLQATMNWQRNNEFRLREFYTIATQCHILTCAITNLFLFERQNVDLDRRVIYVIYFRFSIIDRYVLYEKNESKYRVTSNIKLYNSRHLQCWKYPTLYYCRTNDLFFLDFSWRIFIYRSILQKLYIYNHDITILFFAFQWTLVCQLLQRCVNIW